MNRDQLKAFAAEVEKLGAKYGMDVNFAGGQMGENEASVKFKIIAKGEVPASVARYGQMYGIDVNKPFMFQGKPAKIVDFKPRSYKFPWVIEVGGKRFKLADKHPALPRVAQAA